MDGTTVEAAFDGPLALSIDDASVVEGDAGITNVQFTVSLSSASAGGVSVDYTTVDGTATAADPDFTTTAGTLQVAAGQTAATLTVPISGDPRDEADETFTVVLSSAVTTGGPPVSIADGTGVGTIVNDDAVSIVINDVILPEGTGANGTFELSVSLSNPSDAAVSVDYATSDGTATAPADYAALSAMLTFAPGETAGTVVVPVVADNLNEADETFQVVLSNPTGGFGTPSIGGANGLATITDDDPVGLSIGDVTLAEGDAGQRAFNFTVALSNLSEAPVTVDFATEDVTATTGDNDYVANAGTLTIPAGDPSAGITVTVTSDLKNEPNETFWVRLSNPAGGFGSTALSDAVAVGAITDDDPVVLSIDGATVLEGDAGTTDMQFIVSLASPSDVAVTVDFTTADGTAASGDGDFVSRSGTLNIQAGDVTGLIGVSVIGDVNDEADETLTLILSNPTGGFGAPSITDGIGFGTITDDDAVAFFAADETFVEGTGGAGAFELTVSLSGWSDAPVSVDYATIDASATSPDDYSAVAGTLAIPPGATAGTIVVPVVGDRINELNERFQVVLSNPTGGFTPPTDGRPTGIVTIQNDDAVSVRIDDVSVVEGAAR